MSAVVAGGVCLPASSNPPQLEPLQPSAAWPQFRGDARLTGAAVAAPPTNLKLLWTYEAGGAIQSSAAVANGMVYVGSNSGDLVAVDFESGKLRWKHSTKSWIGESSPAVHRDVVFVGDFAGTVHAVDARDDRPRRIFKTGAEVKASPIIVGDVVVVGSYNRFLHGLDVTTGRPRWKLETDGPIHATPSVLDGIAYFNGRDEVFRAVRAADGKVLFEIPSQGYVSASAIVEGARAYLDNFNSEVFAIDLRSHTVAWRYRGPDRTFPYYSSASQVAGRLVVGGRDAAARHQCVRPARELLRRIHRFPDALPGAHFEAAGPPCSGALARFPCPSSCRTRRPWRSALRRPGR